MTDETLKSPKDTKGNVVVDLIWLPLERDKSPAKLVPDLPGINAVAVWESLINLYDPSAALMLLGFSYFILRYLRDMKKTQRVDRAARYMSENVIETLHTTRMNNLHYFLCIYTDC